MHGRDCHFRPLLVMNFTKFDLKKVTSTQFPLENYLQAACFMLEFAACNMLYPGKVENWMCISDIGYRGLTDLPLNTLRKITKYLQDIFKCRVAYSSMINTPKSIYFIYSCLKPFLDPVTIEKISIEKGSEPIQLLKYFNPYQVEQKYGGKAPNLEIFWPPVFPDYPVTVDGTSEPIKPKEYRENVKYLESQEINIIDEHSPDEVFFEENQIEEKEEIEQKEEIEDIKSKTKRRKHIKKRKTKELRVKRRLSKSVDLDELPNLIVSEITEKNYQKVMKKPLLQEFRENPIYEIQDEGEVNIEEVNEIIVETNSTTSFCQWNTSNCQIY